MATTKKTAKKASTKSVSSETKVTRITAKDSGSTKKAAPKAAQTKAHTLTAKEKADITENKELKAPRFRLRRSEKAEQDSEKTSGKRRRPLRAMKEYFKGSWYELRQVRWPDRATTWQMTGALIGFTVFISVIILLLDALFKYLFQLMIGS